MTLRRRLRPDDVCEKRNESVGNAVPKTCRKIQTPMGNTTVSMKVPISGRAGFQIKKKRQIVSDIPVRTSPYLAESHYCLWGYVKSKVS